MGYTFRTNGPWGTGTGEDLTPEQIDGSFWQAIQDVMAKAARGNSIVNCVYAGGQITLVWSDNTLLGPYQLPQAEFLFRGPWAAHTPYLANEIFTRADPPEAYVVIKNFTSGASWVEDEDHYLLLLRNPKLEVPPGGEPGMLMFKASRTDYDATWNWLSVTDLRDVDDVSAPTSGNEDLVTWNGGEFTFTSPTELQIKNLIDMEDVQSLPPPDDGDIVYWNETNQRFGFRPAETKLVDMADVQSGQLIPTAWDDPPGYPPYPDSPGVEAIPLDPPIPGQVYGPADGGIPYSLPREGDCIWFENWFDFIIPPVPQPLELPGATWYWTDLYVGPWSTFRQMTLMYDGGAYGHAGMNYHSDHPFGHGLTGDFWDDSTDGTSGYGGFDDVIYRSEVGDLFSNGFLHAGSWLEFRARWGDTRHYTNVYVFSGGAQTWNTQFDSRRWFIWPAKPSIVGGTMALRAAPGGGYQWGYAWGNTHSMMANTGVTLLLPTSTADSYGPGGTAVVHVPPGRKYAARRNQSPIEWVYLGFPSDWYGLTGTNLNNWNVDGDLAYDFSTISSTTIDPAALDTEVYKLTPSASGTYNASSAPVGKRMTIVVTTSGTTSYTLTFGTNFKTTGTLATGVVSGKVFSISFIGDGINMNEIARGGPF